MNVTYTTCPGLIDAGGCCNRCGARMNSTSGMCGRSVNYYQGSFPHRCPLCSGSGTGTGTSNNPSECRGCQGSGIVWGPP